MATECVSYSDYVGGGVASASINYSEYGREGGMASVPITNSEYAGGGGVAFASASHSEYGRGGVASVTVTDCE